MDIWEKMFFYKKIYVFELFVPKKLLSSAVNYFFHTELAETEIALDVSEIAIIIKNIMLLIVFFIKTNHI